MRLTGIPRFDHHAHQRFGATGANQDPPLVAQFLLDRLRGGCQLGVGLPFLLRSKSNIDQDLREESDLDKQLSERLPAAQTRLQNLQSGDDAVARRVLVQCQQVTRTFATQHPAALLQLLEHIAVANLGTHQLNPFSLQGKLHCHIGHQSPHDAGNRFFGTLATGILPT